MVTKQTSFKSAFLHVWFIMLVVALSLISNRSEARNFYFSASQGDDSRTTAQAQNSATPWKSITKLNSFFSSLLPGDSVLFKKGEVFSGTITPTISGTSSSPIVISSYGTGAKPVITGFQTVTGWTNEGGGIYSKTLTVQSMPNMVAVNGINRPKGRYPNTSYLTIDSHVTNTSITDAATSSTATNWTGAELVMKINHWVFNRAPITSHSGTTISYTSSIPSQATNGYGFFIQNDIKALDVIGEWAFRSGKLSMYFGTANPTDYTVKVSTIDKLLYIASKNYISIKGLEFEGANVAAIHLPTSNNIKITYCDIRFSGTDAILTTNSDYTTVSYCTFDETQNDAFAADTYGGSGDHVTFSYNYVRDTYMHPGMSGSGDGKGFNISMQVDNGLVEFNTIKRVGYHGIIMGGNNTIIRNNYIDSTNLIKDDGGSIYVSGALTTTMSGRIIENNIVTNAIGNGEGTTSAYSQAYGIYADGTGNNVIIRNNTVTKCTNSGIYMGLYTHHIDILNNTLVDNTANMFIQDGNTTVNNMNISGNIFASTASHDLIRLTMGSMAISTLGTWSGNYYIKPFGDQAVLKTNFTSPKTIYDGYSLSGWNTFDATAHGLPLSVAPYKINSLIGSNKFANGTFTSNTSGATSYYKDGTATSTWDNTNKISGGSLKVSYSSLSSTTSIMQVKLAVGALKSNTKYILRYDILGTEANRAVGVFLKYGSAYYTNQFKYFPYTNTVTSVEILLEPNSAATVAELFFEFRDEDGTVYIDNIEFMEADVIKANPNENMLFEYATSAARTIPLSGTWKTLDNASVSGSITLQPYTSVVLLKSAGTSSNTNKSPVILNQKFQLDENKPVGTKVGIAIATDPDAGQTKTFSIVSGNTNGAFAINASTGEITVATVSALNFEVTPVFALLVKVQDNGTGNLSSQATIDINLLNVNEMPVISDQSCNVVSNSANGTAVATLSASDPDAGQVLTWSIVSGNTGNAFSVNPATGILTVANSSALNFETTLAFALVVKVQDNGTGILTSQATVNVNMMNAKSCSATGQIAYQVWNDISTSDISTLTSNINYPDNPASANLLTSAEIPSVTDENFGARIAGFICAPLTGNYTFWIASTGKSELWLSADNNPANKNKIAYLTDFTSSREWDKYTTQKSLPVTLDQGQKYYFEALLKDGSGPDDLALG